MARRWGVCGFPTVGGEFRCLRCGVDLPPAAEPCENGGAKLVGSCRQHNPK